MWELPGFTGSVPRWFGDFLRWIVQRKFNSHGELETMEPHEWSRLRGEIGAAAAADHTRYGEVARWFLVSSENRPLRPESARSRREVEDRLVTPEAGVVQLGRAHELDPANALARLALARFEADPARAKQLRESALLKLPVPVPLDLQRRIDAMTAPR